MVIVKEILLTCVIYATTLYRQSERDIPHFCVTWVLLWFGMGYTQMVSSAWSDSNAYSSYFIQVIQPFFWKSLSKFYLHIDYFGINLTTMNLYLYVCMYVISKKSFVFMHIYLIPIQDAILLQWGFILACSTIRVLIFTG